MRKLIVLMLICSSVYLNAQERHTLGPTIGLNFSNITDTDLEFKPGFNIGLLYNYSFNENWGLGIDLKYSGEGGKYTAGNPDINVNLGYLRVPVRGQYFFGKLGQTVRPKIYLGPALGFLLNAKNVTDGNKVDVKSSYSGFDLGLNVGFGVNFNINENIWLNTDLGYTHGLVDISESAATDAKNQNINLNIGVGFGF